MEENIAGAIRQIVKESVTEAMEAEKAKEPTITKEEIMAIKDPVRRQTLMAENIELFK